MIDKQRIGAVLAALAVLLTAVAGPAAATVFPSSDTASIVVEVSWDDANVASGDTADLNIEDVSAGTTADTATVTVRNASGTDTYWLSASEYSIPTSSDATTEVDVVLADGTLGSVGDLKPSQLDGSQTVETGPDQGVSANMTLDDAPEQYQPANVTVTAYDGGTELGSTTVAVDNSSASYAELGADELALESTTNVTVSITEAVDDAGNDATGGLVASYDVSTFDDGGGGGGGGGGGSGDTSTSTYALAAMALVAGLLLMRD